MKGPLILIIVGGGILAISGLVLLVSLLLPIVNAGKASWEEAMMGIIPGGGWYFILLGGVIWLFTARTSK